MPAPSDAVRALKTERPAEGTQDDQGFPAQVNSEEDGIVIGGFFLGRAGQDGFDKLVGGFREGDDLHLFDDTISPVALQKLFSAINNTDVDFLTGLLNGDFLAFNSTSGKFEKRAPATAGPMQFPIGSQSEVGVYTTLDGGFFKFWGKDNGPTPDVFDIIAFVESATRPGSFRVQDTTNGNTIAEVTGVTDLSPDDQSMTVTPANITAASATWEMQALRGGAGAKFVRWETLLITMA